MEHTHSSNEKKEANCCALDEKIKVKHTDDDGHNHGDEEDNQSTFRKYLPATISFVLLVLGIAFEQTNTSFFHYPMNLIWFVVAYFFVGLPVNLQAFKEIRKGNVLIVGHSNTVDDIANKMSGQTVVSGDLKDNEYDNLFIIKRKGKGFVFKAEKYGAPPK